MHPVCLWAVIGECSCFDGYICTSSSAAPSAAPASFQLMDTYTVRISVQWGPVDCIHRNGDITGYSVQYGVQGNGSTQTMSVSGGAATEACIANLTPSTTYSIEVAAVNSAGTGVYSVPLVVMTWVAGTIQYATYTNIQYITN